MGGAPQSYGVIIQYMYIVCMCLSSQFTMCLVTSCSIIFCETYVHSYSLLASCIELVTSLTDTAKCATCNYTAHANTTIQLNSNSTTLTFEEKFL